MIQSTSFTGTRPDFMISITSIFKLTVHCSVVESYCIDQILEEELG